MLSRAIPEVVKMRQPASDAGWWVVQGLNLRPHACESDSKTIPPSTNGHQRPLLQVLGLSSFRRRPRESAICYSLGCSLAGRQETPEADRRCVCL